MDRPALGLIDFDVLRIRRGCALALAGWQDRLVLLLMAVLAAAAFMSLLDRPSVLAVAPAWAAIAALCLSASIAAAHGRRLETLARHSIAAPLALARPARAAHLAAVSALSFILLLAAASALGLTGFMAWPCLALLILAWAVGAMAGAAGATLWRRPLWRAAAAAPPVAPSAAQSSSLLAVTLRTQLSLRTPSRSLIAAFALGAAQAGFAGICARTLNPFASGALAVAAALATFFAVARVSAATCRFGLFAGVPTTDAVVAHIGALSAAISGALLGALMHYRNGPGLVWLELGCGLVVALVIAFRVLHYRIHPKLRADRLMQAQIALLAMAAAGLPPLVPVLLVFRAVMLYRSNRDAIWGLS
jgi:hypothetical protein